MSVILRKIVKLIFFTGIFSYFIPDQLSKTIYNCIIICFALITVINSISDFKIKDFSFQSKDKIEKYQNECVNFQNKYNLFFEDFKNSGENNEN